MNGTGKNVPENVNMRQKCAGKFARTAVKLDFGSSFLSLPKNAELIFSSFSFFHVVVLEGCVFLAMR